MIYSWARKIVNIASGPVRPLWNKIVKWFTQASQSLYIYFNMIVTLFIDIIEKFEKYKRKMNRKDN